MVKGSHVKGEGGNEGGWERERRETGEDSSITLVV